MTLVQLNDLPLTQLKETLTKCCGSRSWVEKMCSIFPVANEHTLLNQADKNWLECNEDDWMEAFRHHPKIGDIDSLKNKFFSTGKWAEEEQSAVKNTTPEVLEALAAGNKLYEDRFGYLFIVCATGKSAEEMMSLLRSRLLNTPEDELRIAIKEQNKIMQMRLMKLLQS